MATRRTDSSRIPNAAACAVLLLTSLAPATAFGHSPLFGPGPHTMTEGTIAGMTSAGHQVAPQGRDVTSLGLGAMYAVTTYVDLSLSAPYSIIHGSEDAPTAHGFGDPMLQAKWRPLSSLSRGNVDSLSLMGGVTIPGGDEEMTGGNTTYILGATAGRENLRYYLFAGVQYQAHTAGLHGKPGNTLRYDAAAGIRPFIMEYEQPDAVFLLEFNGTTMAGATPMPGADASRHQQALRTDEGGDGVRTIRQAHAAMPTSPTAQMDDGGTELAVTPEALLSWGPAMLKLGVQLPFYGTHEETGHRPHYRLRADLIIQH